MAAQEVLLATHAYVAGPPMPGVLQQNSDAGQDIVVEFGGHAMVALTTMPASFIGVVPELLPLVAPVVPDAPVVAVPLDVPVAPVLDPLPPPEFPPLPFVDPPHAAASATPTQASEIMRALLM